MSLLFEEETYVIRGAVFEACKEMGCGVLEAINLKLGLLINFGSLSKVQKERFAFRLSVLSVSSVVIK